MIKRFWNKYERFIYNDFKNIMIMKKFSYLLYRNMLGFYIWL